VEADRSNWSAQEYADALNHAATPADLFELAHEVNEKWSADLGSSQLSRSKRRRILPDGDFGIASTKATSPSRL
jgi:hypothetical protein